MQKYWLAYKSWAKQISQELKVIYLACRDPRTPWYAKTIMVLIIAYAASPIDLIPDFIPIFGLLDDMLLVPLGIYLALKLIPSEVIKELKLKAIEVSIKPSYWVMAIIIGIWLIIGWWFIRFLINLILRKT